MKAARVLRHSPFRRLWLAQSASTIGDRVVLVALALFVTDLTGSPSDVGLVLAAHTGPFVIFLLLGGVWADRLPRQRLIVATDLVRFALHALLAVLILTGAVEIWHIVVIEACFGTAEAFFRPAYTGLIPQTVPEAEIQEANALSAASANAAEFIGPALATALVVGVGAGWAFAVDAATFAFSAALMLLVRPRARGEATARQSTLGELRAGFAEVRGRAWVWVTIAVFSIALMVGLAPFTVLGPALARDFYGAASTYGVIWAVFGGGTLVGAAIGLGLRPRRPMLTAFLALAGWPVLLVTFGLGFPLPVVLVAAGATGIGFALFELWWNTALAERIPPHALSRVSSYDWMGSLLFLPVGYALAGPTATYLGGPQVVVGGGVVTALCIAVGLWPRETRHLARLERHAPVLGEARLPT